MRTAGERSRFRSNGAALVVWAQNLEDGQLARRRGFEADDYPLDFRSNTPELLWGRQGGETWLPVGKSLDCSRNLSGKRFLKRGEENDNREGWEKRLAM